jgi:UDP-N-acetylmuramoylalanine--D-glutamate ligase
MAGSFLVIGLARAGTAMAIALAKSGAKVHVVDQKAADQLSMLKEMDKLEALGIEVTTSWSGNVDWRSVDVVAPSPGVPLKHPTLREATSKGVPIWSEIEVAYRMSNAPIVAITGTNGKTTVTALTYWILKECGKNAVLCGNIAGSGFPELPITTAAQQSESDHILVAEVSSYQLEFIETFRPHACAITNIGEDHIERHGTAQAYAEAKRRIYENQTKNDFAVVNANRPETFPPHPKMHVLKFNGDGSDLDLDNLNEDELWLPGRHNVDNAAMSWLLARAMGANDADIRAAILRFKGVANRMEPLGTHNGITFVNNTMCTNPQALAASIEASTGPLVLIAGGVLDSPDLSPLARIDQTRLRRTLLIGKDGPKLGAHFKGATVLNDLGQAFCEAVDSAEPGDTVLLSPGCKSFDQYEDFIARGNSFRILVQNYIEAAG